MIVSTAYYDSLVMVIRRLHSSLYYSCVPFSSGLVNNNMELRDSALWVQQRPSKL